MWYTSLCLALVVGWLGTEKLRNDSKVKELEIHIEETYTEDSIRTECLILDILYLENQLDYCDKLQE